MARGLNSLERGDIYLYRFPRPNKQRPVVILTRTEATQYLSQVTIAPISSAIRDVPSQIVLGESDGMKAPCAVNLHHITTVQRSQLGKHITTLNHERMSDICTALRFALGCDR